MAYSKGQEILPAHLLEEVRKYFDGGMLYIPKKGERKPWGSLSGSRKNITARNEQILLDFHNGESIEDLCEKYYLGIESIKKIVYGKSKKQI